MSGDAVIAISTRSI